MSESIAPARVFWAPLGTDLVAGGEGWTDLGTTTGDGLTYLPAASLTTGIRYELLAFGSFATVPRSVTVSFPVGRVSSGMFRLMFNRAYPRLRAMHCAYSRRLRARRRRR